ncbi:nuclear envelope phosphatase-regulatory subunit 1 [Planococcus citri]|uniref:nuclear envelope phosphatase-regulatory subunit 1 n=1 Tax=Planococcus citri TaxID=170843 RepID=UPI0031F759C6
MSMSVEQTTCEDLKAFERRLTEVIASVQPATRRWRILLGTAFICMAIGACYWLQDPELYKISLFHSLFKHPLFSVSACILICMLLLGGHKKIMTPMIIASRARSVLCEFNMSCDDNGKLILRPRPVS